MARNPYEHFIVGDYIFSPKVYNEFSPGNKGTGGSYSVRGAVEFPAFGLPWMLEGDYRSWSYPHNSGITQAQFNARAATATRARTARSPERPCPPTGDQGCVTVIGAYGQTAVPSFTARDTDFDGRLGLKIAEPRIYIGVGYLHREENYGYPKQNGFGFGAEKLPDLDQPLSVYGSIWYYPSISGNFTFPAGAVPCEPGRHHRQVPAALPQVPDRRNARPGQLRAVPRRRFPRRLHQGQEPLAQRCVARGWLRRPRYQVLSASRRREHEKPPARAGGFLFVPRLR